LNSLWFSSASELVSPFKGLVTFLSGLWSGGLLRFT
jgi:hypothetical protein